MRLLLPVFGFITSWNEYVWPVLILRTVDNYTLPLAMQTYISSEGGTNFTVAMAISLITMFVPLVLYAIFQNILSGLLFLQVLNKLEDKSWEKRLN